MSEKKFLDMSGGGRGGGKQLLTHFNDNVVWVQYVVYLFHSALQQYKDGNERMCFEYFLCCRILISRAFWNIFQNPFKVHS